MFRRLAPTIGLAAGLAAAMFPALARAQVNIDQGKSPAEIFANDCAACHKTHARPGRRQEQPDAFELFARALHGKPRAGGGARRLRPRRRRQRNRRHSGQAKAGPGARQGRGAQSRGAAKPEESQSPRPPGCTAQRGASAKPEDAKPSSRSKKPSTRNTPRREPAPNGAWYCAAPRHERGAQLLESCLNPEANPTTSAAVPAE